MQLLLLTLLSTALLNPHVSVSNSTTPVAFRRASPKDAGVQVALDDWDALRRFIGSKVIVRPARGPEITGRLRDVTADTLILEPHSVAKSVVCQVDKRERDRGTIAEWIVGLTAVGIAVGIVDRHVREAAPSPAAFALIGAGVGTLIGASSTSRQTVYRAKLTSPKCLP
jgi:hypothetical protein